MIRTDYFSNFVCSNRMSKLDVLFCKEDQDLSKGNKTKIIEHPNKTKIGFRQFFMIGSWADRLKHVYFG